MGAAEDLGRAADPAAVGASVAANLAAAVLALQGAEPLDSTVAEQHGMQLYEAKSGSLRLTGIFGADVARVAPAIDSGETVAHEGVHWLHLGTRGAALVHLVDGRRVAIAEGGRVVVPIACSAAQVRVAQFAPLTAPIAEWVTAEAPDWLRGELEACADASLSPLWPATAAGLAARHGVAADPSAEVARILAGQATVPPYRDWIAGLSAQNLADIADLGVAAASSLAEDLADLDEAYDPGDAGWWQALLAKCWRREQLQAARAVLAWHGVQGALDAVLAHVDQLGGDLWAGVARPVPLEDDRLHSAAVVDPDAWWVRLGTGD